MHFLEDQARLKKNIFKEIIGYTLNITVVIIFPMLHYKCCLIFYILVFTYSLVRDDKLSHDDN